MLERPDHRKGSAIADITLTAEVLHEVAADFTALTTGRYRSLQS
jgi:hypothetical protein